MTNSKNTELVSMEMVADQNMDLAPSKAAPKIEIVEPQVNEEMIIFAEDGIDMDVSRQAEQLAATRKTDHAIENVPNNQFAKLVKEIREKISEDKQTAKEPIVNVNQSAIQMAAQRARDKQLKEQFKDATIPEEMLNQVSSQKENPDDGYGIGD